MCLCMLFGGFKNAYVEFSSFKDNLIEPYVAYYKQMNPLLQLYPEVI
jgi:hypothetical protein